MNKLLAGTLAMSVLTNIALLSDIERLESKTDKVLNTLNRATLIATLKVLKENQKPNSNKFKEEKNMKLFGKISNRTKVIGGMTILLGIGTAISMIKDSKEIDSIEDGIETFELIPEAAEELVDTIEDVADAAVSAEF